MKMLSSKSSILTEGYECISLFQKKIKNYEGGGDYWGKPKQAPCSVDFLLPGVYQD